MRTLFVMITMLCGGFTFACDICGCAVGSNYIGILPNYQRHFVGLRYKTSSFTSTHDYLQGQDHFQSLELWGKFVASKRLQILGVVPYQLTHREEADDNYHVRALGDASVLASWMAINNSENAEAKWKHVWQVNAGLKLPTGQSDVVRNHHTVSPGLQPGSGSLDYLFTTLYTVRYKKIGLNNDVNVRLSGTNAKDYRFGNRIAASSRFFYWKNVRTVTLLPSIGYSYEYATQDSDRGVKESFSGGDVSLLQAGMDVFFRSYSLGFNVQQPVLQHLNAGNTEAHTRASVQFMYLF